MSKKEYLFHDLIMSLRNKILYSLKSTLLILYIPLIVIVTSGAGYFSYRIAARQMTNNAYSNIMDTLIQTKNYLDNRFKYSISLLLRLENNRNIQSILQNIKFANIEELSPNDLIQIEKNISDLYSNDFEMINSVLIYFNEGIISIYGGDELTSRVVFSFKKWRDTYRGHSTKVYWRSCKYGDINDKQSRYKPVISVFKLFGQADSALRGIILINIEETFLSNILNNPGISKNGYLALFSDQGIIKFKNIEEQYRLEEKDFSRIFNSEKEEGIILINNSFNNNILVVYNTLKVNKWKIAAVIPEKEILKNVIYIQYLSIATILILIAISIILANFLTQLVIMPVKKLINKTKQVEEGNFNISFDIRYPREIRIINNRIGNMIKYIKELLEEIKNTQEEKRKTDIAVLQAQITPHFLYNTLDIINQMAELGRNKDLSTLINALSNFYRIGLSRGKDLVSISKEIEHVKNYLVILKLRYQDIFEYKLDIDREIEDYKILKLVMQPLVENAIYHGLKEKKGKGLVLIKGYQKRKSIVLQVADNGKGIEDGKLKQIQEQFYSDKFNYSEGYGLINVHRRLFLHFGKDYSIKINSEIEKGTTVTITIPIKKDDGDGFV